MLDIPGNRNGNKRTANVQSVAFTELFSLSKQDIMLALHDYPSAKAQIYEKGKALLANDDLYNPELDNDRLDIEGTSAFIRSFSVDLLWKKEQNYHRRIDKIEIKCQILFSHTKTIISDEGQNRIVKAVM